MSPREAILTGLALACALCVLLWREIRKAPYMCERCGRLLDGPECPQCDGGLTDGTA